MKRDEILIIGGDLRQHYMAERLTKKEFTVSYFGIQAAAKIPGVAYLKSADEVWDKLKREEVIAVLPVPVTTDGISVKGTEKEKSIRLADICPHIKEKRQIFGGNIPAEMRADCEIKQGQCVDFMKSERIAILNAVSTAEGSIAEACMLGKNQLSDSECLVIGYGKCGEILADKLDKFGAKVTVMARREKARAKANAYGLFTCSFDIDEVKPERFSYIFNTVPAMVVDKAFLERCSRETTIIDIASAPGGVDFAAAKEFGIAAELCLGLPGKYAPKTAGEILAEEIIRKVKE